MHRGDARLQQFIGQVSANGTRRAWYLQLDIRNYFMSIDRHILFAMLAARLDDEAALRLTRTLVFHDVTAHCEVRGRPALLARIPAHKTLFGAGPDKGLAIGNLNSQFFANVYLNGLDQLVKHELGCRHYLRYCDDFVLLARDREQLLEWEARIEGYLDAELGLALNPRRCLSPLANGVDFLGYIVRRDYKLVRRRVVQHLKVKLRAYESRLVVERAGVRGYRFEQATLDALRAMLASYLGHLKFAQCWNLWHSLWRRFAFLAEYFAFDAERWKLERRYRAPAGAMSVKRQYRHWRWRFPDDVLFFPVGRFMECYDAGTPDWVAALGLAPMRANRRGARFGFPVPHAGRHLRVLLAQGRRVTVLHERRDDGQGRLQRTLDWRHVPAAAA